MFSNGKSRKDVANALSITWEIANACYKMRENIITI